MTADSDDAGIRAISRRTLLGYAAVAAATGSSAAFAASSVGANSVQTGKDTGYFKCTEFVRRRSGLSTESMIQHWRNIRAPLLRRLPGLEKFTFNVVDQKRSPDTYHAAVEMWFSSPTAYSALQAGSDAELLHRLSEDAKVWMQPEFLAMFTRETVIRELSPGAAAPKAKRLGLVGRPPGMAPEEYFRRWRDEHAPDVAKQDGLVRYTLNFIELPRFPSSPWDGYAELSWTDWPAFEAASRKIRERNEYASRNPFFHSHLLLLVEEIPLA